jgi:hypothetical protein
MTLPTMQPVELSINGPASVTLAHIRVSNQAQGIVASLPADQYLDTLIQQRLRADAVRFIAAWLPPREALWYGILGVWQSYRLLNQPGTKEVLEKLTHYVSHPTQAGLAALGSPRDLMNDGSTMGQLSQAALYTGNNICPYPGRTIKPEPTLVGRMVGLALISAAGKWPGQDQGACLDQFVVMGLDIAEGKHSYAQKTMQKLPGLRIKKKLPDLQEKTSDFLGEEACDFFGNAPGGRASGNAWEDWVI